jgi:hypothetical protein
MSTMDWQSVYEQVWNLFFYVSTTGFQKFGFREALKQGGMGAVKRRPLIYRVRFSSDACDWVDLP